MSCTSCQGSGKVYFLSQSTGERERDVCLDCEGPEPTVEITDWPRKIEALTRVIAVLQEANDFYAFGRVDGGERARIALLNVENIKRVSFG